MSGKNSAPVRSVQRIALERPILTSLVLLAIAFFFKWVDTFVLRLDERLGEIILCKTLGFVMVIVFVWAAGRSLRDIGLHSGRLGPSLLIGTFIAVVGLVIGYGVEFVILSQNNAQPAFQFTAIDPKAKISGNLFFALFLIVGNFMNSFMEEGLFRGVMIRLFRTKLSFGRANVLQALLFGVWHLPWVVKWIQTDQIEAHGGLVFATISQFLPMVWIGLIWGYLYLKTDSLWTPWIAHLLNNTILNLLHVTTTDGLDAGIAIRMTVCLVVASLSTLLVRYWTERSQMPEVKPWGQWAIEE